MSSDRPSVPYVVKYPWYMKLMALLFLGFMLFVLLRDRNQVVLELWEQRNLFFRLWMLLCAVGILAGIAEIFFYRMVFSESAIEERTKFLRKKFRPYSEIETVEYRPGTIFQPPAFLIITFSDLRTIKMFSGLYNLQKVGTILVTYGNKSIMTTSKELKH